MLTTLLAVLALLSFLPDAAPAPEVDLGVLIQQLLGVVSDWRTGGAIVGMVGALKVLVEVIKLKPIADRLRVKPWALPLLSLVVGFLLAMFTAKAAGATWGAALAAGLVGAVGGLGATGLNELIGNFYGRKRAEDAAGKATIDAVMASDKRVATEVQPLVAQLGEIERLPEAERGHALAAWAKAHPPAPSP